MATFVLLIAGALAASWVQPARAGEDARSAVPWGLLSPEARRRAATVVEHCALHRRLPTQVFRCDPETYLFLVNKPDVTVAVWRALGISHMRLKQVAEDRYVGDDGRGTRGSYEFLYRSPGLNVILCEGIYRGPLLRKPVHGTVLLVLRSAFFKETDRNVYVTHRLDVLVRIDSDVAEVIAKLTGPITGPLADRTFQDVTAFVALMSHWIGHRPDWADKLADRLVGVSEEQKEKFRTLAAEASQRVRVAAGEQPEDAGGLTR